MKLVPNSLPEKAETTNTTVFGVYFLCYLLINLEYLIQLLWKKTTRYWNITVLIAERV
jgi:hypothetical protein